ncbi:class I SAM-dependent methyltransferase [Candidatus Gracilibacteria bacterium]|nr:class I SAM-dependent methyltransferase [Candidatus Gracilibacteria bacterium]
MTTDYNNFAKTFSKSRKNMKWEELEYFFSCLQQGSILDIGCGSGRLIEQYTLFFSENIENYYGVDMSSGLIDEAQISFPEENFAVGNMLDIQKLLGEKTFNNIFLIASFHHLETLEQREIMMKKLFQVCKPDGKIYMTNWALESQAHLEKYKHAKIKKTENKFGSSDFNIKFGDHDRFYHSFSISELAHLADISGFMVIENRLFDNEKNIVTILKK